MPVKPGAYALLDWLREQEWRVALATSTGRESTMHHLESAKMTDYFDQIITGEQVEHGKPDPEIYLKACQALELRRSRPLRWRIRPTASRAQLLQICG